MGVVCTLVSYAYAYAEGPVKEGNAIVGHVIEKGSEAGLPYAAVLVVETGEGTVTDGEGYFPFQESSGRRIFREGADNGLCHADKEGDGQQGFRGRHAFCHGRRIHYDG